MLRAPGSCHPMGQLVFGPCRGQQGKVTVWASRWWSSLILLLPLSLSLRWVAFITLRFWPDGA
jgi:hypothetical protein